MAYELRGARTFADSEHPWKCKCSSFVTILDRSIYYLLATLFYTTLMFFISLYAMDWDLGGGCSREVAF